MDAHAPLPRRTNGDIPSVRAPTTAGGGPRAGAAGPSARGGSALVAIVLLALFGVFGLVRAHATAAADPLHVEVDDPERFRFKTIEPVEVRVQNGGETTLDSVVVRFERAYVDASFVPEAGA